MEQAYALSRGLHPVELKHDGLLDALRELAQRIEDTHDIRCTVTAHGDINLEESAIAYHLYRIAQEAIHNAVKHADSPAIHVRLAKDSEQLVLSVRDIGKGMPHDMSASQGMGLHTMRYRANMIGASFQLFGAPDEGATVTCTLPLPANITANAHSSQVPHEDPP
jgi:signal transduction histidine kinase